MRAHTALEPLLLCELSLEGRALCPRPLLPPWRFHGAEGEARVFGEESARGVVLSRGLGSLWVCNEVALVLGPVVGLQAPPLSVAGAWVSCKSGLVVPLSTLCLCEPFSFSARSGDSLAQAGGDADA